MLLTIQGKDFEGIQHFPRMRKTRKCLLIIIDLLCLGSLGAEEIAINIHARQTVNNFGKKER